MPRYHFNLHDGEDFPDRKGTVLTNLAEARSHALRYTCDLLSAPNETLWSGAPWHMEVTDETGLILFRLDFCAQDAPSIMASR